MAVADDRQQLSNQLASLRIDRAPDGAARSSSGAPRWIVYLLVLALLAAGGYALFNRTQATLFPDEVELGLVTLISPQEEGVTLVATGYVYPRRRSTVAPKTAGRINRLFVDEGDQVKEGQALAELESAEALAQLAQVKADIAAAKARIERARADVAESEMRLGREQRLLGSAASTPAAVDDAKARQRAAKAQLEAATYEAEAVAARQQLVQVALDSTKVRAPFSGTVVRKLAEVGEVIAMGGVGSSGAAGLFTLVSLEDLEVQADVSEAQLNKIKTGTPAEILLDAFPDRRFKGEVHDIRQTVDRAKAAVTVKVRLQGDVKGVLPDMAAKVNFLARALDEAALKVAPKLVVAPDSITSRSGRKVVLAVEEGKIKEVPVAVGGAVGSLVELTSGPGSGTRVVRRPADVLKDGSTVKEKGK